MVKRHSTLKLSVIFAAFLSSLLAVHPLGAQEAPDVAPSTPQAEDYDEVAPSIPQEDEEEEQLPTPSVEDLGDGRYRIRHIVVDKPRQRFDVPGAILRQNPPLEFLAVATEGAKGYESLIELDADAFEFNAACILIGLDADNGKPPRVHFDPMPTEGDPVDVWVSWETPSGKTKRIEAADLVQRGETTMPRGDWVYTGSLVTEEGTYLAHLDGTLIGFSHDPASVIEHRAGFGLGDWGSVQPNLNLLPPVRTRVTLTIQRRDESK